MGIKSNFQYLTLYKVVAPSTFSYKELAKYWHPLKGLKSSKKLAGIYVMEPMKGILE